MKQASRAVIVAMALAACAGCSAGEAQNAPQPYKLGMFQEGARSFAGIVVRDSLVVDLSRANINAPATLQELIARWDQPTADRLGQLAGEAQRQRPSFAFDLSAVKVLVPLPDPDAVLMAARNYAEHANEMAQAGRTAGTTSVIDEKVRSGIPGLWVRQPNDQRPNPYLFPKLKSSLIADGTPIVLPPGRTRIDYECELVAVIGKTASRVPVDRALDYVFGYMAMTDVSDREDRADERYGSDWLISKSYDTFGPNGPFIVPAQFVGDPQNLAVKYTLNGKLMQDASTSLMVHTVRDLISYASNIATLGPGDLLGTGTPGGVGEGRVPPVYLKAGDTSVCTIEKIGSLTNPVQSARVSGSDSGTR